MSVIDMKGKGGKKKRGKTNLKKQRNNSFEGLIKFHLQSCLKIYQTLGM